MPGQVPPPIQSPIPVQPQAPVYGQPYGEQQPVSPKPGYPTSGAMPTVPQPQPYTDPSGWASAPPQPPRPRRSPLLPILIGISSLLALALVATVVVGLNVVGGIRTEVDEKKAARDNRLAQEVSAQNDLKDRFAAADLPTKLNRVKDLDKATDVAFDRWNNVAATRLGEVTDAMQLCNDAVAEYDRTAAPFPASMLGELPDKINLSNPQTDCGRAFTKQI